MNQGNVRYTSEGPVTVRNRSNAVIYVIIGTSITVIGFLAWLGLVVLG